MREGNGAAEQRGDHRHEHAHATTQASNHSRFRSHEPQFQNSCS